MVTFRNSDMLWENEPLYISDKNDTQNSEKIVTLYNPVYRFIQFHNVLTNTI